MVQAERVGAIFSCRFHLLNFGVSFFSFIFYFRGRHAVRCFFFNQAMHISSCSAGHRLQLSTMHGMRSLYVIMFVYVCILNNNNNNNNNVCVCVCVPCFASMVCVCVCVCMCAGLFCSSVCVWCM